MFTKEQLEGIILSLANPEIEIAKDDNHSLGYKIKLRIHFRVCNLEFLELLQESLLTFNINSYLKKVEKQGRPFPMLRISNIDNLVHFFNFVPKLPTSNNKFDSFLEVLTIVSNRHHLTQKGLNKILKIKGLST
tara:strand:- start:50 stop:451 length:402 start_codon:yes stop_codon:yes gene_type:complete